LGHSGRDIDTGGDGALLGQPPRALAGTAADLEDLLAGDIAEEVDVRFVNSLRTPDEIRCAEESAVLGQILLGGIVPIAAIGPDRGLFVDRQITAADDLGSVSSLTHRSSVAAGAQKSNPRRAFTPRLVLALTTVCACAYKSKFVIDTGSVNCAKTIGPTDTLPDIDQQSNGCPPYMTTHKREAVQRKQVAVTDIGTAEDFLAAVDETIKYFNDGDIVEGTVVKVDRDEVLVDIGYKTEGVILARELSIKHDVAPGEVGEVGDEIEALVLQQEAKGGRRMLSKKRDQYERAWGDIEKIKEDDGVVTGTVIEVVKGGLIVDIGLRGFLPASLVEM